jgi:hypothetical protein
MTELNDQLKKLMSEGKRKSWKSLVAHHTGQVHKHKKGVKNKLESQYAAHLKLRQQAGEIIDYYFEAIRFNLSHKNNTYTPDFVLFMADGTIEIHETKGFWRDDARVKIKCFAEMYPFRTIGVTWDKKKGWIYEEF